MWQKISIFLKRLLRGKHLGITIRAPKKKARSLSQYYLIGAIVITVAALTSAGLSVWTFHKSEQVALEKELTVKAQLIDSELANYFRYVSRIAEDKGYKISIEGAHNLQNIAYLFKHRFVFPKTPAGLKQKAFRWPYFAWADKNDKILVDSETGILSKSIDTKLNKNTSQYDHLYLSKTDNWELHLSNPQYDSTEGKFFIHASLGVSDIEGDESYIGAIVTKFEVGKLIEALNQRISDKNIHFVILDRNLEIVMASDNEQSHQEKYFAEILGNLEIRENASVLNEGIEYKNHTYKAFKASSDYPFKILVGYNPDIIERQLIMATTKKVVEVSPAILIILLILYLQQKNIIERIQHIATVSKRIGEGVDDVEIREHVKNKDKPILYPLELHELREGLAITKVYIKREKNNRLRAEKSESELASLNTELARKNEAAKKSKKKREQFIKEQQRGTIEEGITKMTKDISLIMHHDIGGQELNGLCEKMLGRCARMLAFVSDDLNLSFIAVEKLIEDSVDMQSHDADIYDVELLTDIKDKIPDIYIDKRGITQLVTALIYYAMQDRKRNQASFVKIDALVEEYNGKQHLKIVFEDNGNGVDEDTRLEFEKEEERQGKPSNGTAMSLYAIRHIIALHRGAMKIDSEFGKGSTITVHIPYRTPEEIEAENHPQEDKRPKRKKNEKIIPLFPNKNDDK